MIEKKKEEEWGKGKEYLQWQHKQTAGMCGELCIVSNMLLPIHQLPS